jgi:acetyltransferase
MNVAALKKMFRPRTIAVVGASNTVDHVGFSIIKNLISSGFEGIVYPVNPKHDSIQGVRAYPYVREIPDKIDLAIIATPASSVPDILEECGQKCIKAAVVVSSGFSESGSEGKELTRAMEAKVKQYEMTVLGPNCLGFMRPSLKLNASFARAMPKAGGIAFISQSGALLSAVLDWSLKENVGFSYFVSTGDMVDIGYHNLIDLFGNDPSVTSILIYMESLTEARRFMSAARNFARTKPIIVLKVGKSLEGAKAALSHTGSITGNDQVFDAAFIRAGILRVDSVRALFDCAKTLAMQNRPEGSRLAIVTNAGGPGVIATDALIAGGGTLSILSPETIQFLDESLPSNWSRNNPVDVLGDADPIRYRRAIEACARDSGTDGVLVILTPQAVTDAVRIAREIVEISNKTGKTVLTAWMGEGDVAGARLILEEGSVPAYERPEDAVKAFMNMYNYGRNLKLLYETPATIPHAFSPDTVKARTLIKSSLNSGRFVLTEPEAKSLLQLYQIPVPRGTVAHTRDEATSAARSLGYPVVMKIISPDIIHKIDVGGVILNLRSEAEVAVAFDKMMIHINEKQPQAAIEGVYLEETIKKRYELIIGSKKDPIFGPSIIFGMGGIAVEVYKDTNIGLPPLNMTLSMRLIEGTKIYKLLTGYRGSPPVDIASIQFVLYKFAYLVMDFPEIKELDINPFAVDDHGGVVLDAKVILDESLANREIKPYSHMVISPYPREYEKTVTMETGETILLRPIRPEDEPMEADMFKTFSEETQRFRFFTKLKDITHELLIRYTQIDYDREIAIIAEHTQKGIKRMLGVARLISDPYNQKAEFAIVLGDPWQKKGLGSIMMDYCLEIARGRGIKKIYAYLLEDNFTMLHMFQSRNFEATKEEGMYRVELVL